MQIEQVERLSWYPNRRHDARCLLRSLVECCEIIDARTIKIDSFTLKIRDYEDEYASVYHFMVRENWIEATGKIFGETVCVTDKGIEVGKSLMAKGLRELERDYVLELMYEVSGGFINSSVYSSHIDDCSTLPALDTIAIIAFLTEEGFLRMEGIDSSGYCDVYITAKGIHRYEESAKGKSNIDTTPIQTVQTINFHGSASNFNIGENAQLHVSQQTGLSGEEVADIVAEIRETIEAAKAGDRETINDLLRLIGELASKPETEKEAKSVARASRLWIQTMSGKVIEKLSVEALIALGKEAFEEYVRSGGAPLIG